jgi:hypothetical protein
LVYGPSGGSWKQPNEYKIRTTPLPPGPRGVDWRGYFNDQLKKPPVTAYHDGNAITAYCNPDGQPNWLELVDAAIEKANEQVGTSSP